MKIRSVESVEIFFPNGSITRYNTTMEGIDRIALCGDDRSVMIEMDGGSDRLIMGFPMIIDYKKTDMYP